MKSLIFVTLCLIGIFLMWTNCDGDATNLYGNPKGWVEPERVIDTPVKHPYTLYPRDTTPYKGNYVIPEIQ